MLTLIAISERLRVSTGSVTPEKVDIVADETDGARGGAMAVSAFASELGAN